MKSDLAGDTLNVASRLSAIAGADEILVGQEVFRQASRMLHESV